MRKEALGKSDLLQIKSTTSTLSTLKSPILVGILNCLGHSS
jgi:hypothetical protein